MYSAVSSPFVYSNIVAKTYPVLWLLLMDDISANLDDATVVAFPERLPTNDTMLVSGEGEKPSSWCLLESKPSII